MQAMQLGGGTDGSLLVMESFLAFLAQCLLGA